MPNVEHATSLRSELFVLSLAFVSVLLLIFDISAELQPHQDWVLEKVDLAIAFVFLFDFLWRLYKAEQRESEGGSRRA